MEINPIFLKELRRAIYDSSEFPTLRAFVTRLVEFPPVNKAQQLAVWRRNGLIRFVEDEPWVAAFAFAHPDYCTRLNDPLGLGCSVENCPYPHQCFLCNRERHGAFSLNTNKSFKCPFQREFNKELKQLSLRVNNCNASDLELLIDSEQNARRLSMPQPAGSLRAKSVSPSNTPARSKSSTGVTSTSEEPVVSSATYTRKKKATLPSTILPSAILQPVDPFDALFGTAFFEANETFLRGPEELYEQASRILYFQKSEESLIAETAHSKIWRAEYDFGTGHKIPVALKLWDWIGSASGAPDGVPSKLDQLKQEYKALMKLKLCQFVVPVYDLFPMIEYPKGSGTAYMGIVMHYCENGTLGQV